MTLKWQISLLVFQLFWCLTHCRPQLTCNPEVQSKIYFDLSDLFTPEFDYNTTVQLKEMNGTIYFNFCYFTSFHCAWEQRSTSFVYLVGDDQNLCFPLTSRNGVNYSLINDNDPTVGLKIIHWPARNFSQFFNVSQSWIEFIVSCSKDEDSTEALEYFALQETEKKFILTTASYDGCPYTITDPIWDFVGRLSFIFFTLLVSLGSLIAFFGGKMVRFLMVVAIGFAVFWATMITLFSFFDAEDYSLFAEFIVFFLSGTLAGLAAFYWWKNDRIGPSCIGMWTGLLISMQIYLAATALISYSSSAFALVTMMIIGGALGAHVGNLKKNSRIFYIFCSSFLGCWLCMKGLSIYLGGYPNVFEINKKRFVEGETIGLAYHIYLAGQILMNVVGFYMQLSVLREEEQDEENFTADDNVLPIVPLDRFMNVSAPPRLQKELKESEFLEMTTMIPKKT